MRGALELTNTEKEPTSLISYINMNRILLSRYSPRKLCMCTWTGLITI